MSPFCGTSRPLSGHRSCCKRTEALGQQSAPGDVQVGQRSVRLRASFVLGDPAVADLAVTEQVLDDVERVFEMCIRDRLRRRWCWTRAKSFSSWLESMASPCIANPAEDPDK